MPARNLQFAKGEYYHIFNRGAVKQTTFPEHQDIDRFYQSLAEFNCEKPIGSIYEKNYERKFFGCPDVQNYGQKIVDIVCYCINPNHYHLMLQQLTKNGVEKFMQKVGTGYTKYFNNKYDLGGSLFQGKFKAKHINSNNYLLHLSAYVSLNNKVHDIKNGHYKSSLVEYTKNKSGICNKDIILSQFKNIKEYEKFMKESLKIVKENRELEELLIE